MKDLIYDNSNKPFYKDKSINNAYMSQSGGLPLIRFSCFDEYDWMDAVMTTRLGGVSSGHLSSLNLGHDRGDDPENVRKNHHILSKAIGVLPGNIIKSEQVHGTNVSYVDESVSTAADFSYSFFDNDGTYTDIPGMALCIGAADCVPIFLVATDKKMVAGVHSGWKGTVGGISAKAVEALISRGCQPGNITALIGPSISQKNYEVSPDVIERFNESGFGENMSDIAYIKDNGHYQLDLWAACFYTLLKAGLPVSNIHFASVCTYDNHDILFSHRYTKGNRGNQNGVIWIKSV